MVKKISTTVFCLLAALVIMVGLQPSEFRVEKSVEINASPESIFFHISDLKEWPRWSPWAARDLNMEMEYSPNTNSVGSYVIWRSETEGDGKQTITRTERNSKINLDLEFYKPWEGRAEADFVLTPIKDGTKLSWGMNSSNKNFIEKLFYLVLGINKSIGKDFESGLANLKEVSEN